MASTTLTGSYSGSNASNYGIRCVCSSTSNGSTANTSNVTVTLQMRRAVNTGYEGQWSADGSATGRIIINGSDSGTSAVYFDTRNTLDWITIKTYTVNNIAHNADGSKSITVTAYFEPNATSSLYGGYVSGTFVLDTIPRATTPTLSATSVTMGSAVTITIAPASTGFKHKIRYTFGSLTEQTSGLSVGANFTSSGNTTVTFTPPTSLGSQIPNANSGTCTIYCYTYNSSGTQIGNATSKTLTLNIPSYTPTGAITISGNNLRGTAYVAGKSTVTGNVTFSTSYGATIKSVVSTVDGKSYTSSPFTSSVLSAGSKSVSVVITDSRNKTKTVTSSAFTVYEYANPYITSFKVERQSNGTSVIATLVGGISAINNQNTKSFKVTLNGVTNTITSSAYTVNGTTTFTNVPTDKTLTATATITDYYNSVSKSATLPTVEVTLDFLADGKGIAMGKVAEKSNLLDVAWNMNVAGNVTGQVYGLGELVSIPANSDMNNYLTPGVYNVGNNANAGTILNIPVASAGKLIVSLAAGYGQYIEQIFIPYRYAYAASGHGTYVRYNNSTDPTTWYPWINEALKAYPVGSIYMSVNSTSPADLFGGTWEQLKNRFLIGCGDTYAAGASGGSATVTLTANEMPVHEGHLYDNYTDNAYTNRNGDTNSYYLSSSASGYAKYENRPFKVVSGNEMIIQGYSRGGGAAHNNMPPYLAVYMWKRIS